MNWLARAVVFMLVTAGVFAQDTTVSNQSAGLDLGKIRLGAILGGEATVRSSWDGRFYLGVPVGNYFYATLLTTSCSRSTGDGTVRVSVNGLLTVIAAIGLRTRTALYLAIIPEVIANPTFDIPVIGKWCSITGSGRTDWYAFSEGGKFSMEGSIGLRLRLGMAVLESRYVLPILHGYADSKEAVAGISLYYGGRR